MRFMIFVHTGGTKYEEGALPSAELVAEMSKYNEKLKEAGMMLGGDGLHPTSKGARISFTGGKPTVTDGPFAESKEVIGGYWLIQAKSKDEAIEWMSRAPMEDGAVLEVRQAFEMEDFPADVQKAAGY